MRPAVGFEQQQWDWLRRQLKGSLAGRALRREGASIEEATKSRCRPSREKRQQQRHLKKGWDLLCWPRFIKETTRRCICMTLPH